MSNIETFAPG